MPDPEISRISSVPHIVPIDQMVGEDDEDTSMLHAMLEDAKSYALSFSWCNAIHQAYFGGGIGKILAIFLFNISTQCADVDSWVWIVTGDVPPAYLPLEDSGSPKEVFGLYLDGMTKWAKFARQGRMGAAAEGVPPVNVPPTPEWADQLESRLRFLNEFARPFFE